MRQFPILCTVLIGLCLFSLQALAQNPTQTTVTLRWDFNTQLSSAEVEYILLARRNSSGPYTVTSQVYPGTDNVGQIVIPSPTAGDTWHITVQALSLTPQYTSSELTLGPEVTIIIPIVGGSTPPLDAVLSLHVLEVVSQ